MSKKELKRRLILSNVMKKAWSLFKRSTSITFSLALKLSWKSIKCTISPSFSKVKGVTFNNRQFLIKRLTKYPLDMISLSLLPEPNNEFDSNAIKIIATVKNKGSATIGYVSKELAYKFSAALISNKQIFLFLDSITGSLNSYLGVNYSYFII